MPRSEIRVQLTPAGLADVISAFRTVQDEARNSSRGTTKAVDGLRTSMLSLRRVLGALGIATSLAGIVQFGVAAFQSARKVVEGAKQIAISAREYSRLQEAIRATKGDIDALDPAIANLRKTLSRALTDRDSEAAAAFKQLRINAEAFSKLPLERQLALIADKVSRLKDEEDRLRAVQDLLGRGAAGLVVSFREGGEAFIKFADDAERAGRVLQDDVAKRIDAAGVAVDRLKAKLAGLTNEGLAFISRLAIAGDTIDSQIESLEARRTALRALSFSPLLAGPARAALALLNQEFDKLIEKKKLLEGKGPVEPKPAVTTGEEELAVVETPEQRRARLAVQRQRIQDELALQQERNKLRRESDQAAYDQGLISLEDYYARRLALTKSASDAEIAALQRQLQLIQASPAATDDEKAKRAAEAEKVRHDIALRRLRTETEIAALAAEETTEQRRLDEQWSQTLGRLEELEGRRHEAFLRNLGEEIRQIEELGRQAGQSAAEIAAQVARFRAASESRETFRVADEDIKAKLDAFDRDARRIQLEQEAGLLTQLEGENRLIALQRERLVVLQQAAAAAVTAARATGDPALIAQAEQYAASVAQIGASFEAATNSAARLRQGLESGIQEGFVDLFTNIDKIHSLGDAFRELAVTVARSLAQIAAEILAKQATFALLRAFGSAFGGATAAAAPGARLGGQVEGYAGGGKVRGRSLPIPGPDKIPALLQEGEFVVRRAAATRPGMTQLLREINDLQLSPAQLMQGIGVRPFAEGGAVNLAAAAASEGSGSGGRRAGLAGVLGLEEGLVFRHLDAPAFDELILKKISRNPSAFRSALGL